MQNYKNTSNPQTLHNVKLRIQSKWYLWWICCKNRHL